MHIDSETLISLVFAKKPLWDKTVKQYRIRTLVDKLWRQVSTELGNDVTTEACKKKWKSLRDHFGKELRKVPAYRSGDPGPDNYETYTAWPHFKSMLFLKGQMIPRKSGGNLQADASETMEFLNDNDVQQTTTENTADESIQLLEVPDSSDVDETIPRPQPRPGKRGLQHQLVDIETRKLKLLEKKVRKANTDDDEDEAFFKSLLPHVRKLKPEAKLLFRMDIQKVVQEHVYQKNRFLNDPNQNLDVHGAATSENPMLFQYSTPVRSRMEFTETIGRTPRSHDGSGYHSSPHFQSQAGIVTILNPDEQIDAADQFPTVISSARQYYTVITSPISSALSQQ
ncbi:uncharacterized protein LOC135708522 [Ochlerotatus camptorhynchus]|uniref:uncharacterized protein LOC135708522 n=1 Tax=Ochlerotatus camptorhynchus TaxID=644619 RepID=UPI0031D29587